MSSISDKQFIFLIGAPRSGTTWLHALIANHPDVAATPQVEQTFFSRYLAHIVNGWELEFTHMKKGDWVQGLPYLWTELEFNNFIKDFFEKVYVKILERNPGATHILDKHPNYSNCVELINRIVPNAKFIHIIRDGRNVAVSMISAKERNAFGEGDIKSASCSWIKHVRNARKAQNFGSRRYLEIRYEDLLESKKLLLPKIFDFCELHWNDKLIKSVNDNKMYSSPNPDIKDSERKKNSMWKDKLSLSQKYVFNNIAGGLLIGLGYSYDTNWVSSNKPDMFKFYFLFSLKELFRRVKLSAHYILRGD